MSSLITLKKSFSRIYSKYAVYINPMLKFLLALIILTVINVKMGYMAKISDGAVVLMAALFCSFMPMVFTSLLAGLFVLLHFYALSLETAIVAAVLLLLMYILYLRFAPKEALVVLLMPILFAFKIPYLMPIAMGLLGTPFSIVSVAFGVILSYLINYVDANKDMLSEVASENMVTRLRAIIDSMIGNKSMICMVICFSVVLILVYVIRRMSFDHSWKVAIIAGAIINIVLLTVCLLGMHLDYSMAGIMFGTIFAALLGFVIEFFAHGLDYRQTENLQFEDEEYYYYVKAVPKFGAERRRRPASSNQSSSSSSTKTVRTANGVRRTT